MLLIRHDFHIDTVGVPLEGEDIGKFISNLLIYMLELAVLLLVVVILSLTLIPAIIATITNSSSFLHHSLITLALLFTILTLVTDVYNNALIVYHTESYKKWFRSVAPWIPNPVENVIIYANANKKWVIVMMAVFFILITYFTRL